MAVSVSRCCGRVWIGCTRTPSVRRARDSAVKRRVSALAAACGLLLAAQVPTARADAPQLPVTPTVPTIAVQVSVGISNVSVNVQGGIVDVSVPSVSVDVSVSVSSQGSLSATDADASAAPQPTTQNDGSSNCCNAGAKQVAPSDKSAKKTGALQAAPPKRLARPTIRAAANGARTRTVGVPLVDRSTRLLAATQVPRRTSERLATRPKARRGCCEDAQAAIAIAAAPTRLGPRPGAARGPDRYERAEPGLAAGPVEHVRDNRLLLQLGVLGAFLYFVCLGGLVLGDKAEAEAGVSARTRR